MVSLGFRSAVGVMTLSEKRATQATQPKNSISVSMDRKIEGVSDFANSKGIYFSNFQRKEEFYLSGLACWTSNEQFSVTNGLSTFSQE